MNGAATISRRLCVSCGSGAMVLGFDRRGAPVDTCASCGHRQDPEAMPVRAPRRPLPHPSELYWTGVEA